MKTILSLRIHAIATMSGSTENTLLLNQYRTGSTTDSEKLRWNGGSFIVVGFMVLIVTGLLLHVQPLPPSEEAQGPQTITTISVHYSDVSKNFAVFLWKRS